MPQLVCVVVDSCGQNNVCCKTTYLYSVSPILVYLFLNRKLECRNTAECEPVRTAEQRFIIQADTDTNQSESQSNY